MKKRDNIIITPHFPSIKMGNKILHEDIGIQQDLKSIYLKDNTHIKPEVLVKAWKIAKILQKEKNE